MHPRSRITVFMAGAFALLLALSSGCGTAAHRGHPGAKPSGNITVSVDPRIELLAVVQHLADYRAPGGGPLLTQLDFQYKESVAEYFAPYRNHPAVHRFREISARGFNFAMPPEAMLSLTDPPDLEIVRPVRDMVTERAGGTKQLEAFAGDLRRFARDANFMEFHRSQRKFHDSIKRGYREQMGEYTTAADIEGYFGWRQAGYHIVLAPFFHPGGFGPRIPRADGVFDVYSIVGPYRQKGEALEFGTPEEIRYLVWHEFGHSFVNHLTDAHIGELMEPVTALMPPIPEEALRRAGVSRSVPVSEWVSEHVIRSVTVRLAYLKLGETAGEAALKKETGRGYPHVERLCRALERYEGSRGTYPTFREFYPEIVEVFRIAARETNKQ